MHAGRGQRGFAYNEEASMKALAMTVVGLATVLVLAGCGGSERQAVVGVSLHDVAQSRQPVLIAVARPSAYQGRGRVIPLSALQEALPSPLPKPLPKPARQGAGYYLRVLLADGQTISYESRRWPPAIRRLVAAMSEASRYGPWSLAPAEAQAQALAGRKSWLAELRRRAKEDDAARFRNLPRAVFYARLRALQARYRFQVVEARILHPVQDAPLVVVKTRDAQAFSRAVPAIQHLLDPKRRTNDDRTGWAYEGFYLQAQDTHGTPFLAIFNYWRGTSVGGGQWASSESLYPFAHL
jgi:hypothetical protein